jgi:hypothetical protein
MRFQGNAVYAMIGIIGVAFIVWAVIASIQYKKHQAA